MGVLQQIVVHLDRPGRNPIELTPIEKSIRWTTLAVGGFGELSFSVAGDMRRELDRLSIARAMIGPKLLCEARLEDRGLTLNAGDVSTTVRCFGLSRLLDDASARRFWIKRDVTIADATGGSTFFLDPAYDISFGRYDAADQSKLGFKVKGTGRTTSADAFAAAGAYVYPPLGTTISRYRIQVIRGGATANFTAGIQSSNDNLTWATDATGTGSADYNITAPARPNATSLLLVGTTQAVATILTTSDYFEFFNIALLGTSVSDDVPRGFYASTLLRDLLTFAPGLQQGIIERGDDFVIQSIDASIRRKVSDIIKEVAGYYAREWGVWEDGRFDWKTPQLDQEQWVCTIADLAGLDLSESIDDVTRTTYLSYVDAASNQQREVSANATDPRNPFAKTSTIRDQVINSGFPMTAASATQLAQKLVTDQGGYVPIRGRVTIPVDKVISNVVVQDPMPALYIRGGENLRIADLPSTDPFGAGRDGETLFHIISAEIDTETGLITLDLEGLTRRQDVILARLAAATRTITG